jgi:DNA invertase Pin-like site-specific DNA recombinase
MTAVATRPKAIGIVRVSQREDDTSHSPEVQARAMLKFAADQHWDLSPRDILDENVDASGKVRKVSGGADLADRPKMLAAVQSVERGTHQIILAERFDRFFRDLDVQREVLRRVDSAGGRMETVKQGAISHATAEAELQANLNGAISQYTKRTARDRSWDAVEVAIQEGKIPWSQTAPGYLRSDDSRLTPDKQLRPVIEKAFKMRAAGATIGAVREHLRNHGIDRSYHGTTHLLRDRVYLGEIHFGTHTPNLEAHKPIIDRRLFDGVQDKKIPRGRKGKSDRLLARLGVLRCATCDSRMVVGTANHGRFPLYRCPPTGSCERRMTISATMVEAQVIEYVKDALAGIKETATKAEGVAEAAAERERADAALAAAVEMLTGLEDVPSTATKLRELRAARDDARARHTELESDMDATSVALTAGDWDELDLSEQRDLIRAVIERVVVAPGRGPDRVRIDPRGESA